MKRVFKYFSLLLIVGLTACDDFLDRYPMDAISDVNYFTTPKDLQTYIERIESIIEQKCDFFALN